MSAASSSKANVFMTGASRGIGLGLAEKMLSDGHNLATFSRSLTPELKALSEKYPKTCFVIRGDVTNAETSANAVTSAAAHFGGLDSVVLNSGLGTMGTVRAGSVHEMKTCFEVNFFGNIPILQAALPILDKSVRGARIVLVSSTGGIRAGHGLTPYCTSKAAVNALARSLGVEEPNITTVAVNPGLVDTDMVKSMVSSKELIGQDMVDLFSKGIAALDDPTAAADTGLVAIAPHVSGARLACLALHMPKAFSGQYKDVGDLSDPEIVELLKAHGLA